MTPKTQCNIIAVEGFLICVLSLLMAAHRSPNLLAGLFIGVGLLVMGLSQALDHHLAH